VSCYLPCLSSFPFFFIPHFIYFFHRDLPLIHSALYSPIPSFSSCSNYNLLLCLFLVVSGKPREYPIPCKYPQQITSVQESLGPDRKSPSLTTGFTNELFPRYRQYLHHQLHYWAGQKISYFYDTPRFIAVFVRSVTVTLAGIRQSKHPHKPHCTWLSNTFALTLIVSMSSHSLFPNAFRVVPFLL
jgi:hypothetical protein